MCVHLFADKYSLEDTEKLLQIWIKMSANPECVAALLDGLAFCRESAGASGGVTSVTCLRALLEKAQQKEACLLEKSISTLLHSLAQVKLFSTSFLRSMRSYRHEHVISLHYRPAFSSCVCVGQEMWTY